MLIQDMFPITADYIERPYTINNIHLVIKSKKYVEILNKKSANIYRLIHRKVKFNPTQPDALSIKLKLFQEIDDTADSFYSAENMAELERRIESVRNSTATFREHELIEDDDE